MGKVSGVKERKHKIVMLMTVTINLIKKMALVSLLGNQEINIKEHTKMMKDMVMVKCIGLMEVTIKVNG